jgi:hypothetical protein
MIGVSFIGVIELLLPVVEIPEPRTGGIFPLVGKVVRGPRECIDGTDVRAPVTGDEKGCNGEVFVMAACEPLTPGESR